METCRNANTNEKIVAFCREKDTVIATMNVLFDKAAYEKGRSLKADVENDLASEDGSGDQKDGKVVKKILKDSLVSGKVGSLSVDPNYLDFEALECKFLIEIFYRWNGCEIVLTGCPIFR